MEAEAWDLSGLFFESTYYDAYWYTVEADGALFLSFRGWFDAQDLWDHRKCRVEQSVRDGSWESDPDIRRVL